MRSPSNPSDRDTAGKSTAATARLDRQKAALKANMARRKAQAKARSAEDAPGNGGPGNDGIETEGKG